MFFFRVFTMRECSSTFTLAARRGSVALALALTAIAGATALPARAATTTLTFPAVADAAVYQTSPSSNFGSATKIRVEGDAGAVGSATKIRIDAGAEVDSFLNFTTSGISGTIQSAKVQITAQADGTGDGPTITRASTSWSERSITWKKRPGTIGGVLADTGAINAGAVASWDVTSAVTGNGTYGFKLSPTSDDGVDFYSRQWSNSGQRPVLVVTVSSGGDTTPPTVSLTAPSNGSTVSGNVAVSADASDNAGVAHVDFSIDGNQTSSDSTSPYSYTLDTTALSNGSHTITAKAFDAAGNTATSSVSVTVANSQGDTTPPTVSLTAPANGATVSGSSAVAANASDNLGVSRVDFYVDGSVNVSDSSSPYGYTLDSTTLSNGSHTIGAKSYDAAGNSSSMSSVSVTVSNGGGGGSCNLYASPNGTGSGTSQSSPASVDSATSKALPGYTVCLLAGTYSRSSPWYVGKSGSAGNYIVFKSYGGTATFKWTGGGGTFIGITSGTHYVELNGLSVDANNTADSDINCNTADHVRIIGNTLTNGGAAAFSSYHCDYMVIDSNRIHHAGYTSGFSSAISVYENQWSDNAAGFHTVIARNIISGSYDASSGHSDGNGIIVDTGGDIPPTLIIDNLVYQNYYRCLHTVNVQHVWEINNTCYKNVLRYNPPQDVGGEINQHGSTDIHVINNIVYAWTTSKAYKQESGSSVVYQCNSAFGGIPSEVPAGVLGDPTQIRVADPLFVSPLYVDPTQDGQWATATPPWSVGSAFQLQSSSPLIDQGVDPHNATGMTSALRAGLDAYFTTDLAGAPRLHGGAYDLGAYER